ncbi:MAG: ATP-binding protein [Gemmatimonadetes bacterium]|nr:MAG: ATP-binding protein [Gemmatimonadota bacterium]
MTRKHVLLSWSGGKDSALALQALRADSDVEVVGLLTSVTRDYERISVHGVRRSLLECQAERLRLPLFTIELDPVTTNDVYESAFLAAVERVKRELPGLAAIAFGDLFLADVRAYRERLLAPTGLDALFPIWGVDTAELAHRFVEEGFVARLVCVDTTQLDGSFAHRMFDDSLLAELPPSVDPCGERGEFHTFVSYGPGYDGPVGYTVGDTVLRDERFAYGDLIPVQETGTPL